MLWFVFSFLKPARPPLPAASRLVQGYRLTGKSGFGSPRKRLHRCVVGISASTLAAFVPLDARLPRNHCATRRSPSNRFREALPVPCPGPPRHARLRCANEPPHSIMKERQLGHTASMETV